MLEIVFGSIGGVIGNSGYDCGMVLFQEKWKRFGEDKWYIVDFGEMKNVGVNF